MDLDWILQLGLALRVWHCLSYLTAKLASGDTILRAHVVRLSTSKPCWHDLPQAYVSELFDNGGIQPVCEGKKRVTP
jgi:hypothetical protein